MARTRRSSIVWPRRGDARVGDLDAVDRPGSPNSSSMIAARRRRRSLLRDQGRGGIDVEHHRIERHRTARAPETTPLSSFTLGRIRARTWPPAAANARVVSARPVTHVLEHRLGVETPSGLRTQACSPSLPAGSSPAAPPCRRDASRYAVRYCVRRRLGRRLAVRHRRPRRRDDDPAQLSPPFAATTEQRFALAPSSGVIATAGGEGSVCDGGW